MSIYVVPDIHGEYDKLIRLMEKINKERKQDDTIVFLGDYIDRGSQSKEVVEFVYDLVTKDENVEVLLGNHDLMLFDIMTDVENLGEFEFHWIAGYCVEFLYSYGIDIRYLPDGQNGIFILRKCLMEFKKTEDYKIFEELIFNCKSYYEEGRYIFSHSGGVSWQPIENQTIDQLVWSRDFKKRNDGYIYVCGHTPTISGKVEMIGDVMMCDTGAVFKGEELPFIKLEETYDE